MQISTPLHPEQPPRSHPQPASCSRTTVDCLTWVRVSGEVDLAGAPALAQALSCPFGSFPLLVMVDMREVTFLDAAAAHVLLDAAEAIRREGGRLVVVRGAVPFDWWFALVDADARIEVVGVRPDGRRDARPTLTLVE